MLLRKLAGFQRVKHKQLILFSTTMIESIVLYASEAWGTFVSWKLGTWDRNLIERINFRICKSILQVSPNTDSNGARSELGRLPLLYSIQKRSLQYWSSVRSRPDSIIAKLVADAEYNDVGIGEKMNSEVMQNCQQTRKTKSIKTHRENFESEFRRHWSQRMEKSAKLSHFYYTFKKDFSREKYLTIISNPEQRRTMSRFRLGNHKLACETLRTVRPKIAYENRTCPKCRVEVENETHILFRCDWSVYVPIRNKFIEKVAGTVRNFESLTADDKIVYLMTQESTDLTESFVDFIESILKAR